MPVLVRSFHGLLNLLRRARADCSGNVAIIFALTTVVMLMAIGAAIDVGRWLHARDQTVAAIDAALLAGGRALQTNSQDAATALATARKFYAENVTSRLPVTDDSISFNVTDDGTAMTASGTAYIKTPFLQVANIDKLPLISTATSQFSKAEIAIGGNGGENIEIAMMLDVTGSMAGQKIQDLKDFGQGPDRHRGVEGSEQIHLQGRDRPLLGGYSPADHHCLELGARHQLAQHQVQLIRGWLRRLRRVRRVPADLLPVGLRRGADGLAEIYGCRAQIGPVRDGALHPVLYDQRMGMGRHQGRRLHRPGGLRGHAVEQRRGCAQGEDRRAVGGRRHRGPARHGLGLVHAVAQLELAVAELEHAGGLRYGEPAEDRHPDDRRRVQHAVRIRTASR